MPKNLIVFLKVQRNFPYTDDVMEQWEACQYWLQCLTAVTRILSDAVWETSMESVPFQWEDVTGWRVMSDNEYQNYSECENNTKFCYIIAVH